MNFLVLGGGEAQKPAILRAKDKGLRVIVIDPSPQAPGLQYGDEQYCHDLADIEFCVDVARRSSISGVMTMSAEYPVPTLAAICESLSLPGLTTDAARNATNKRHMRDAFNRSGVPSPQSISVETLDEARTARASIHGTCIVKPTVSNGGRGITQIQPSAKDAEFEAAAKRALGITRSNGILIEQFIEGPEFSVETMTHDGTTKVIAVTEKLTTESPYFAEIGHNQPSGLSEHELESIVRVAIDGVASLGIDHAAGHVELRLTKTGPVLMEIGARLGGGYICSDLVPLSTGIDMVSGAIDLALGREPDLSPRWNRGAAIRFFRPSTGQVRRISGVEKASKLPGCHRVSVECRAGDTIHEIRDATSRVGYVIFSASDRESAAERAEQAISLIQIKTSCVADAAIDGITRNEGPK